MINLQTGQPGAGKSLFTIWHVENLVREDLKEREKTDPNAERRAVYYSGIKELDLPWIEMKDPLLWYECPTGSLIVMDECQRQFRPLPNGAKRPQTYEEFQTHRHQGFDIFLITQEPKLIDTHVRAMCGYHRHMARSFGISGSTLYEWQQVNPSVMTEKLKDNKEAIKSQWKFPKEVFTWYKSAEVHTHTRKLPWKKLVPIGSTFVIAFAVLIWVWQWFGDKKEETTNQTVAVSTQQPETKPRPAPRARSTVFDSPLQFKPVIEDLPMSAPVFSKLVEIRDYPRVDGCSMIEFSNRTTTRYECTCNDQRGNIIEVTEAACEKYVTRGIFDYTVSQSQTRTAPRVSTRAGRAASNAAAPRPPESPL